MTHHDVGGAVTISQYIYYVCGHTGDAVSGVVYRAQVRKNVASFFPLCSYHSPPGSKILDPLVVPRVDVSLDVKQNDTGVLPGRYVYRVSRKTEREEEKLKFLTASTYYLP
jgi:hypothetical protein